MNGPHDGKIRLIALGLLMALVALVVFALPVDAARYGRPQRVYRAVHQIPAHQYDDGPITGSIGFNAGKVEDGCVRINLTFGEDVTRETVGALDFQLQLDNSSTQASWSLQGLDEYVDGQARTSLTSCERHHNQGRDIQVNGVNYPDFSFPTVYSQWQYWFGSHGQNTLTYWIWLNGVSPSSIQLSLGFSPGDPTGCGAIVIFCGD